MNVALRDCRTLHVPRGRGPELPSTEEMYEAVVRRDAAYDGIFYLAVQTTGIYCRPSCPARKPNRENIQFFGTPGACERAGYRACLRCRPKEIGADRPAWVTTLLDRVDRAGGRRLADADLRKMGIEPSRARRYFRAHFGMTFHGWQRARRITAGKLALEGGMGVEAAAGRSGYESASGFREAFLKQFGSSPRTGNCGRCVHMTVLETPLGPMAAGADDDGVCFLEFVDRRAFDRQLATLSRHFDATIVPGDAATHVHLGGIERELGAYLDGELRDFQTPLVIRGTPFQESVWRALLEIPYGQTMSYAALAGAIGRTGAQRAVGRANGDNRLAIVVPCHRVVQQNGALRGYGGGLWRKQYLLDLERGQATLDAGGAT